MKNVDHEGVTIPIEKLYADFVVYHKSKLIRVPPGMAKVVTILTKFYSASHSPGHGHGPSLAFPPCISVCTRNGEDNGGNVRNVRNDGNDGNDQANIARCFTVTGSREDFVLIKELSLVARDNGMSMKMLKKGMQKMGGTSDDNCCVRGQRNGRGFIGVCLQPEWKLLSRMPSTLAI